MRSWFPLHILDPTNFASDKIYNISGGAGDVAFGMVRMFGAVTGESVAFVNVYLQISDSDLKRN